MIWKYLKVGGPVYDLANDIFADSAEAYQKLSTGGGENVAPAEPAVTPAEPAKTQDVDPNGQGKEQQPVTPDKSAEDKSSDKIVEEDAAKKEKEKVDGAAKAREWGAKWEKSYKDLEAKHKEAEPLLKIVEDEIGGEENLKFAVEIYKAVANEDDFNAENALEFLSNNLPGVATKLTEHIAKEVIERTTSTSLARTFGRNLSESDVKAVKAFLAAGKPSDSDKYASFFKSADDLPDELKIDPATGEERDPAVLDYIRNQRAQLLETQAQLKNLEGKVTGADEERHKQLASDAIEKYVSENFVGIGNKISELGLDKPIPGETPEIAELREKYSGYIEGLALHFASKDVKFQSMYTEALKATAKLAINPKDRGSRAKVQDFSRRITAKVNGFAAEAAEVLSPQFERLTTEREKQIEKVNKAKDEPNTQGEASLSKKHEIDPKKDPFDSDDIQKQVEDIMRAARGRR